MSEKPISPLRRRMIEDMTARNFVEKTHNDYIRHVRTFTAFLGRASDTAACAGRPLLSRRIHAAGADCRHRLPEQGRRLRSLVQGFLADNAHDCRPSQAPGRQDRLHLGTPHLGLRDRLQRCVSSSP
jgi:hypothetical protein